jgi:uncharacterized membrane protein
MDHLEPAEHGHELGAPISARGLFNEQEWQEFRAQDLAAAKYIVGLMLGIFIIGLLLYTGVALWVGGRVV